MSRFWSPVVAGLTPYVPGEQPKISNLVKLNTNEHPYGPSPRALAAMQAAVSDSLRLYPDPNADALKTTLARHHGVAANQVFVGNGSDEVLAHVFFALLRHETPLVFPDITYSFYPVYSQLYGIRTRQLPLADDFSLNVDALIAALPADQTGAAIFPNPNAPTGRGLPLVEIERLVAARPNCLIVVDEAYVDFGAESAVALVTRHPNVLVVQTFSKSRALAGLRVGYAIGDVALIDALERVKNSFNSYPLDRIAQAGAVASVDDDAYFRAACARVIAHRTVLVDGLQRLGFDVVPSQANFVLTRHPDHDGAALAAALRERAIIVRHFATPRIAQYLRITVGTEAECAALLTALDAICAG